MDVSETEAVGVAERAAEDEVDDGSGAEMWDRLGKDTLNCDPRASSYAEPRTAPVRTLRSSNCSE